MATKASKRSRIARAIEVADRGIDEQIEQLTDAIEEIEKAMRPYEELNERRNKLIRSRNALQGGTALTGAGTTRLTQEQVVGFLKENPGARPMDIANAFNVAPQTVGSHLYRGKSNGRYLTKDKRWWARDPKSGINTEDDLPDEEDE